MRFERMAARPRFPWQIPPTQATQLLAIKLIKGAEQCDVDACVDTIRSGIKSGPMAPTLASLASAIVDADCDSRARADGQGAEAKQAAREGLCELYAAFAYRQTNAQAGCLSKIDGALRSLSTEHRRIILEMFRKKRRALLIHRGMWFLLRSACVDVYVTSLMVAPGARKHQIFYGGESHVQHIEDYLRALGAKQACSKREDPLGIALFASPKYKLRTVSQWRWHDCTIGLLGEEHHRTNAAFASAFLNHMQKRCENEDTRVQLDILVECHISADNSDQVQRILMCNQPECALHRVRCSQFVQEGGCWRVRVREVDNRHYDLGFLRGELTTLRGLGDPYRQAARDFDNEVHAAMDDHFDPMMFGTQRSRSQHASKWAQQVGSGGQM